MGEQDMTVWRRTKLRLWETKKWKVKRGKGGGEDITTTQTYSISWPLPVSLNLFFWAFLFVLSSFVLCSVVSYCVVLSSFFLSCVVFYSLLTLTPHTSSFNRSPHSYLLRGLVSGSILPCLLQLKTQGLPLLLRFAVSFFLPSSCLSRCMTKKKRKSDDRYS